MGSRGPSEGGKDPTQQGGSLQQEALLDRGATFPVKGPLETILSFAGLIPTSAAVDNM